MSEKTNIIWTEATWNVLTGCSKVTAGCKNCYALRDWARLAKSEKSVYFGRDFTDVAYHPERLDQPLRWQKPRMIFVNSMSDLFHEKIDYDIIDDVFAMMALCESVMHKPHVFQVLTKRADKMHAYLNHPDTFGRVLAKMSVLAEKYIPKKAKAGIPMPSWPLKNVWVGVSVENQEAAVARIPLLLDTPASVRWISAEPLLGDLDLTNIQISNTHSLDALRGYSHVLRSMQPINKLDWIVVGGESGPKARMMSYAWAKKVKDDCEHVGTAFVFKQWGAFAPSKQSTDATMIYLPPGVDAPAVLDNREWIAYPVTND